MTPFSASFERAFDFLMFVEGGYVNNKYDKGGKTKYGISKKAYPQEDIENLTIERAKEIYRRDYWESVYCDNLIPNLALVVFDFAVNSGVSTAVKYLQRAVNIYRDENKLEEDGILGPKTKEALLAVYHTHLVGIMIVLRRQFFNQLVERDASQRVFLKGWMNRIDRLTLRTSGVSIEDIKKIVK